VAAAPYHVTPTHPTANRLLQGVPHQFRFEGESNTSQGKSLSLICGALTWLRDHKGKEFEAGLDWGQDGKPCHLMWKT
jgi:hypothetical protein